MHYFLYYLKTEMALPFLAPHFSHPRRNPSGEVVYSGKLNESREDEGVADGDEPVHGCGIGHLGQRVSRTDT